MRVKVLFLGGSRGEVGTAEDELELPEGATVADAVQRIIQAYPVLAPRLSACRWARNFEFTEMSAPLADGDELALIPPVAGGAAATDLTEAPIVPERVMARVQAPSVGATVCFVGTVRDHARGKSVQRLEYEAYRPMADRQLERIAQACEADHPGVRMAITHRYGTLEVGEISIVIAAASAHRAAAFDACRQAIERIKVDVPIWKRELTTDGEEWVGWGGG